MVEAVSLSALALLVAAALVLYGLGVAWTGLRMRLAIYPDLSLRMLDFQCPPALLRALDRLLAGALPLRVEALRVQELSVSVAWDEVSV